MDGKVSLRVAATHAGVPSQVVGWGPKGIVSVDGSNIHGWNGDVPGTQIPFSTRSVGDPRAIVFLPDGSIGVAAARVAPDGTYADDAAAIERATSSGVTGASARDYRVQTAAWTPDGEQLWIAVEHQPRRGRGGPAPRFEGPRARNLVLDDRFAVTAVLGDDGAAWQRIVTAGDLVVTVGSAVELRSPAAPDQVVAELGPPPMALAVEPSGASVLLASAGRAALHARGGGALATWTPPAVPTAAAIAPGGALVALGDAAGTVHVYRVDGATAELAGEVSVGEMVIALAFAPAGDRLAVGLAASKGVAIVDVK